MPVTTAMPIVSNTVTSTSYAKIALGPRKSSKLIETNSPRSSMMDPSENTSGKEESNSSDKNNKKVTASDQKIVSSKEKGKNEDSATATGVISPTQSSSGYPQVIPPHETPQDQRSYYREYNNSQVTPESPSTSTSGNGRAIVYDGASFFQQQSPAGFHSNSPFTTAAGVTHQYTGNSFSQQPPNSPTQSMSGIPPASPLFPRMTGPIQAFMNPSRGSDSNLGTNPAMSSIPSTYVPSGGMYIPGSSYPMTAGRPNGSSNNNINNAGNVNNTNEEFMTWNENCNISYPLSPGQGIPYVSGMPQRPDRSASFDDTFPPPSESDMSSVQQPPNAYGAGPGDGPPLGWGYGGPPLDVSQGRSGVPYPGQLGGPQFRHPTQYGGQYGGQFGFATTSPGPAIQTTNSNKGPDGANLFVFHIPNHFTNLDMYQLFCPYGHLLSVRIMVEKDSGRSRGFGFVSYDYPEAAVLAIKELNGFTIGNKRLKVQHKQLRPGDQQQQERNHGGSGVNFNGGGSGHNSSPQNGGGGRVAFGGRGGMNLPPSGPMARSSSGWYNNERNSGPPYATQILPPGDNASGDSHHVVVVVGDDPNSPNVTAATVISSVGGSGGGGTTSNSTIVGSDEQQHQKQGNNNDPLSSMEPLRQTLPDIGGVTDTQAVLGEN